MVLIENGKSSADNLREIDWVQQQTKEELNALTNNVESNFYEKNEDGSVTYKMDLVKQYLAKLRDETKDMSVKEAWEFLKQRKSTSVWIIAVQIALESIGKDVKMIDGKIIIGTGSEVLSIPKDEISDTFWEISNEAYRLYLYGAKIANMIHFIKNKYSKDDELFLDDDGILKLDRTWPIPNVNVLKDWSNLGISNDRTKKEFAKYLQRLGYKCEIKL